MNAEQNMVEVRRNRTNGKKRRRRKKSIGTFFPIVNFTVPFAMKAQGIQTTVLVWNPCHFQPISTTQQKIAQNSFSMPCHAHLYESTRTRDIAIYASVRYYGCLASNLICSRKIFRAHRQPAQAKANE